MPHCASFGLRILLVLFLGFPAVSAAPIAASEPASDPAARQAIAVKGPPFFAALAGVDRQGKLTFRSGDQLRTLPLAELVAWGAPSEITSRSHVLLADGGLLAAEILSCKEDRLQIDSDLFGVRELPLELVVGAICHQPADLRRRDLLAARLRSPADRAQTGDTRNNDNEPPRQNSDRLILENGDELTGTIASIDAEKLELKTPSGPVEVERDKVAALGFNPALLSAARPRGAYALVGFSDGSRLAAASLVIETSQARVMLASGMELATDAGAVTFLQTFGGQAAYLSDLPEDSYRHVPYLTLAWPFERDRSVSGSNLRAGGRSYVKGVGMHSAARLTFRLDPKYRRFEAEAAIDDETAGRGSVVFRVFVDDREAYKSPVIRGGMPPTPISVDVRGAKRLSLIVDFAERGDELDHADWLNARLVE